MAERTLQGINLWALRAVTGVQKAPARGQEYQKLLEMELNTQTNLISSAISDDGKWLAASDSYEVRLWRLKANVSSQFIANALRFKSDSLLSYISRSLMDPFDHAESPQLQRH